MWYIYRVDGVFGVDPGFCQGEGRGPGGQDIPLLAKINLSGVFRIWWLDPSFPGVQTLHPLFQNPGPPLV